MKRPILLAANLSTQLIALARLNALNHATIVKLCVPLLGPVLSGSLSVCWQLQIRSSTLLETRRTIASVQPMGHRSSNCRPAGTAILPRLLAITLSSGFQFQLTAFVCSCTVSSRHCD
ncbi:hypothetical protein DFH06DRAFT_749087 [Mycena polygramma]|nr:hypothetical protein DFH06DRAFT_749087 [Mycena polygramma]